MPRKKRPNWPLRLIFLAFLVALVGYVFLQPLAAVALRDVDAVRPYFSRTPLVAQIMYRGFEFFITVWFFLFGACLGSFLSVVIYRSPRGVTLLGSSRCPYCRVDIRLYDNVPVLAWLALRGRCRACRLPISSRYPIVELTVGVLFLVLAIVELFLRGSNLPPIPFSIKQHYELLWLIRHPNWDLVTIFVMHSFLVISLFTWAMIKYDGLNVPRFYLILVLLAGIVLVDLLAVLGQPTAFGLGDNRAPDGDTAYRFIDTRGNRQEQKNPTKGHNDRCMREPLVKPVVEKDGAHQAQRQNQISA